jgi:hypothetical protein
MQRGSAPSTPAWSARRNRNAMSPAVESAGVRLGLAENLPQFLLLMIVNALVGGMVGLERTVVPLIGAEEFRIASTTLIASFIVSFGVVKAFTNLLTGHLADLYGRKRLLVGAGLGLDHRRQRAARRQPGTHLVRHRHHEDRSGRTQVARPRRGDE